MAHFHHFSISNQNQSMSSLVMVAQNTKAIALLSCHNWLVFIIGEYPIKINQCQFLSIVAKYHGYSLTFWPEMAHFHHFSISNQNQSMSILDIFGQSIKAIALLFSQKWLIFITFQSAIEINQFQIWSFLSKIPWL